MRAPDLIRSSTVPRLSLLVLLLQPLIWAVPLTSIHGTDNYRCPAECSCLDTFVDCSRRKLQRVPEPLPRWTEILDLSHNRIDRVDGSLFRGLDQLSSLDLSDNRIEYISSSVFEHTPRLSSFVARKNRLYTLPLGLETLHLERLDLRSNRIRNISVSDISRICVAQHADLSRNDIHYFPPVAYAAPCRTGKLDLAHNKLFHLPATSFSVLRHLTALRLSRNRIESIERNAFHGLNYLQSIDLSRNRLQSIQTMTFTTLVSLETLSFHRNVLTTLDDGAFWGLDKLKLLNISHNHLNMVADGWLYGLTFLDKLDLSHNQISQLDSSVWSYTTHLQYLLLDNNRLRRLRSRSFNGLKELKYLQISNNDLDSIDANATFGLSALEELDLSSNRMAFCIEDELALQHVNLPHLKVLKFTNNRIRNIPVSAFYNFPNLKVLDLSDNPISTIMEGAFDPLQLEELYINTKLLICDCKMEWFVVWIQDYPELSRNVHAFCEYPDKLRGFEVNEVKLESFVCEQKSPRVVINTHPASVPNGLMGGEALLECAGEGAPPLAVYWQAYHNGRSRVIGQDASTTIETKSSKDANGTHEYIYSKLRLQDLVKDDDGAYYQCLVQNHYGTGYSEHALLNVREKPRILNKPHHVVLQPGQNAHFTCSATGIPKPTIKWKKDNGYDFPAAQERRLHVHVQHDDDILYITNVSLADAGVYTCQATNEAGHISESASLTVLESTFGELLDDRVAPMDGNVTLDCSFSATPTPTVRWLHNDQPLDVSSSTRLSTERNLQLLVISQLNESDQGKYTCQMLIGFHVVRSKTVYLRVESPEPPEEAPDSPPYYLYALVVFLVIVLSLLVLIVIIHSLCHKRCSPCCAKERR
uniref:LRRCT domain-containing protein n=1 Tax=Steinernema glaseri TaxID=37863 RepID=A0A1I7ZLP1_9BILA